ncbi:MAG: FAD-dependent monooxygenase [Gammaproteobacteria bacterium]|nr:FAD-dependent monooxygenase [Gammaproteobacteria bacterium]
MNYDVIIIGGGMVGATLALTLSQSNLRVALVDATPLKHLEDHRLIALNYDSVCFLSQLKLWDALADYAEAIQKVHVSDKGQFGKVCLQASDLELPALGYVIPAKFINIALNNASLNNTYDIFRPATLKTISQTATQASAVILADNVEKTLTANLIIAADGTHSTVRDQLNIATETIDYKQKALVTVTHLNRSHHHIAYERFQENGAIAMLPLTEQRVATIWTDENKVIDDLMKLTDAEFLKTLQKQFGYRLGRLLKTELRLVYPLKMITAKEIIKERIVLIGNAAHTLSPIAAQGLNLALAEISMLVKTILQQLPLITTPNWDAYLVWQQQQQNTSSQLTHRLTLVFSKKYSFLNLLRPICMTGLDLNRPLKKRFAFLAMGKKNILF